MIAIAKLLMKLKGCVKKKKNVYETVLHLNLQVIALYKKYTIYIKQCTRTMNKASIFWRE